VLFSTLWVLDNYSSRYQPPLLGSFIECEVPCSWVATKLFPSMLGRLARRLGASLDRAVLPMVTLPPPARRPTLGGCPARQLAGGRRPAAEDVASILEAASRGEMANIDRVSAVQLRNLLRVLGQKTSGTKPQLVQRLRQLSDDTLRDACDKAAGADAGATTASPVDLLTGADLAQRDRLIAHANDIFYDAYEHGNIEAMEQIWGADGHVKCGHPGRRFATGYDQVMESWTDMLEVQRAHFHGKIFVTDIRIVSASSVAWVTCTESWDQGPGEEAIQLAVLHVFRLQQVGGTARKQLRGPSASPSRWLLECRVVSRLISNV